MIAGALKTINSKYFKSIAQNTKDLAENHHLSMIQALHTISPKNYFELHKFQPQFKRVQPKQKQPMFLVSNIVLEKEIQTRLQLLQLTSQSAVIPEQEQTILPQREAKKIVQIKSVQTLQFQANSPIQDRIVCKSLQTIDALCVSVFDGHGGSTLSEYASKKINELIDAYLSTHLTQAIKNFHQQTINVIKMAIEYAYNQIQDSFFEILENQVKTGNKQIIKIGSCALTCVVYDQTIIVANCGDSQGLIVKREKQEFSCFSTNQQLNTSNNNEINRIKQQFKGKDDQVLVKSKSNNKIYIKSVLQPTRTLGDYYLKKQKYFQKISKQQFKGPYITHKPVFHIIPVQQSFEHLIIASDGLWDFSTKKQIVKIVQNHSILECQSNLELKIVDKVEGLGEIDLSQTYIEKVPQVSQQQKKLTQKLRDMVLQKCAKRKGKTIQGLLNVQAGQRRTYCDDISIVTVSFSKTKK